MQGFPTHPTYPNLSYAHIRAYLLYVHHVHITLARASLPVLGLACKLPDLLGAIKNLSQQILFFGPMSLMARQCAEHFTFGSKKLKFDPLGSANHLPGCLGRTLLA